MDVTDLDNLKLERAVVEVFGGCNYTCKMCPQALPGRESAFLRKMPFDLFENILDQLSPRYGYPLINLEGSGEPTLAPDLDRYVAACTQRNLRSFIYCNGKNFHGDYMRRVIDAGLDMIRFSVIGYNRELYHEWMSQDNWDLIRRNASEAIEYVEQTNQKCSIESYHLILDPNRVEYEVEQYQKNFIRPVGTTAYIWKMHNWSGNYQPEYHRAGHRRTCGRPHSAEITIRAGGINGERAAVTPCCQTMGPPNESQSVLGHFSNQSFEDIWLGELYQSLRKNHADETFDNVDYCKNCDFLLGDTEVMIWTNASDIRQGRPLGTDLDMNS